MSYYSEHQIFYINSNNRSSGTNENFSYILDIDRNFNYDRVLLLDATIPKSFYNVQTGFNTFTISEDNITRSITLPIGNYNRNSFANDIALMKLTVKYLYYFFSNQNY